MDGMGGMQPANETHLEGLMCSVFNSGNDTPAFLCVKGDHWGLRPPGWGEEEEIQPLELLLRSITVHLTRLSSI